MGVFFHSICATDLNFGNKNTGRTKLWTLKTLIFENFWGPEVSGGNLYQKNIGAKLTHWHMPLLSWNFVMIRSDHVHPSSYGRYHDFFT